MQRKIATKIILKNPEDMKLFYMKGEREVDREDNRTKNYV